MEKQRGEKDTMQNQRQEPEYRRNFYAYTSEQFEKCQSVLIKLRDIFLQSGIEGAENYVAEMTQVPGYTTDATCLIKTDFFPG